MAERLHLTIGEVLSLLRQEFPDVSISKIRFLESQGLVNPERTPSGYRKFYEPDVERLRWILRQQREHFLPLKVILDRLGGQPGESVGDGAADSEINLDLQPAHADLVLDPDPSEAAPTFPPPVRSDPGAVLSLSPQLDAVRSESGSGPAPSDLVLLVAPLEASGVAWPEPGAPADPLESEADPGAPVARTAGGSKGTPAKAAGPKGAKTAADSPSPDHPSPDHPSVDQPSVDQPPVDQPSVDHPSVDHPSVGAPVKASRSAGQPDVYSVAELAEAANCTPQLIRDLEQFGILVAGANVGGKVYFESDAVAVARVSARFSELGVEPRHLRTWRNAAVREASLFEQLVMPLLRQRNPQSRRDAAERLEELTTLGGELRAGLIAEALRSIK